MTLSDKQRREATVEEMKFQLTVMRNLITTDAKNLYINVLNEYVGKAKCTEFCDTYSIWSVSYTHLTLPTNREV